MAFRLMIRYFFAEVIVPQVNNDYLQRMIASHRVNLEYVGDVTPQRVTKTNFFLAHMQKTEQGV